MKNLSENKDMPSVANLRGRTKNRARTNQLLHLIVNITFCARLSVLRWLNFGEAGHLEPFE
jgi:hypothetical protein